MSDDLVKQSIEELQDLVRCCCHPAYSGRGLQDPECECDSAEAVKIVAGRIDELEAKLAKALTALTEVREFVEGLEPYAEQGHTLVPALQKACTVYAELTGGKDE